MIGWFAFVVVGLATYRLARIVTLDTISQPFRDSLFRWAYDVNNPVEVDGERIASPRGPIRVWVYDLASCPLCAGVWIAAGLYVLWRWSDSDAVRSGIVILAAAGVQCFLASRADA